MSGSVNRGNQPDRPAKKLIRRVGVDDVALAGAESRRKALENLEDAEIQEVRATVRAEARALEEDIAELRMEIDSRAERRERWAELTRDKVEQARLWRSIGVQEKIPLGSFPNSHDAVLRVLAASGVYGFAQAYAALTGVAEFGAAWLLGCLFGLAACVTSVFLARPIKVCSLARAQRRMLKEEDHGWGKIDPAIREQLVVVRWPVSALAITTPIFIMFDAAGALIRIQGSAADHSFPLMLFLVLVPILGVVVEFYQYNPIVRDEPAPNWVDRRLERKLARAERRLRIVAARIETKVTQIEKLYRVEEAILEVERRSDT